MKKILAVVSFLLLPLALFGQQGLPSGQKYYDFKNSVIDNTGGSTLSGSNQQNFATTLISANGALPVTSGVVVITQTAATASTLAAPAANGVVLRITSSTAFAHVITATGLINNGTTGGPHNTMTWAAFPGASITLIGYGGLWYVASANLVTVA
jgi:hypothetical protein